jgi:monovalent cation/hydrogen antiporter
LWEAARVAGWVILGLTATRMAYVMGCNLLARRFTRLRGAMPPPTLGQGVAVAWSGMRGLVTLATAFALPPNFPQRDIVELTAFAVVLATLVIQGLTLAPLIHWLKLDRMEDPAADLAEARRRLAQIGRDRLAESSSSGDLTLGELYGLKSVLPMPLAAKDALNRHRRLGLGVVEAQRRMLTRMRDEQQIDIETYYMLQEEIDWRELTLLPDDQRRIQDA